MQSHYLENREIVKSSYLSQKWSNFDAIRYTTAAYCSFELGDCHITNYEHFYNSSWMTAAILKIIFGHNSTADCLISVKFCTEKKYSMSIEVI